MVEYLGYQGRPEPVNWLKIAQGAITDINTIEADRQKQRDALEKSADDLVSASKEYKPGQSGSFNGLVLNGADRVRSTTLYLKKQLMNGRSHQQSIKLVLVECLKTGSILENLQSLITTL